MDSRPAWSEGPRTWYPQDFWPIAMLFGGLYKTPSPSFEEWATSVTPTQVHELLNERFQWDDPPAYITKSVSREEVAHYETVLADLTGLSLPMKSDTEIFPRSKVLDHLGASHPDLTTLIASAADPIERLLITHATFPFLASSSSTLTRSSLLRAIILLTSNSDREFEGHTMTNTMRSIRARTPGQRTAFIFASLQSPLPRKGSTDDVLDILCRIPYPREFHRKIGSYRRRPLDDLVPVAKRLSDERKEVSVWQTQDENLAVSGLRPLADLVAALNGQPASDPLNGKEQLSVNEFQAWAIESKLMPALDKLFSCFLRSREAHGKSRGQNSLQFFAERAV